MPKKYEYEIIPVNKSIYVTREEVNNMSDKGWRLVGVDTHLLYFERDYTPKTLLTEGE